MGRRRLTVLDDARLKIDRANLHIDAVEVAIKQFLDSDAWAVVSDDDAVPGRVRMRFVEHQQTPRGLALVVGDAAHNLRSALGYTAFGVVRTGLGRDLSVAEAKAVDFPICTAPGDFLKLKGRRLAGATPAAIDVMARLQPYASGKRELSLLAALNNSDKHRVPTLVGGALQNLSFAFGPKTFPDEFPDPQEEFDPIRITLRPQDSLFPLEDGTILFECDEDMFAGMAPQIELYVAFGENDVIAGAPVVPTLRAIASEVRRSVEAFAPLLEGTGGTGGPYTNR